MRSLTSLGETVGGLLKARGETVAVSESSTGGLVSAALLAVPGASAYFMGGGVIYTHPARKALLGVRLRDHPGIRSASEPYAAIAAAAMRDKLETGAAGPTGNRYGDAAGHTCVAVVGPVERRFTLETGSADREANMWAFAEATLAELEAALRVAG